MNHYGQLVILIEKYNIGQWNSRGEYEPDFVGRVVYEMFRMNFKKHCLLDASKLVLNKAFVTKRAKMAVYVNKTNGIRRYGRKIQQSRKGILRVQLDEIDDVWTDIDKLVLKSKYEQLPDIEWDIEDKTQRYPWM